MPSYPGQSASEPLNPLAPHIPPEALPTYPQPTAADCAVVEDSPPYTVGQDFEPDLTPDVGQRFDTPTGDEIRALFEPETVLLERRGVTSHPTPAPYLSKKQQWQVEFWAKQTIHKNTVAAKLRAIGQEETARGLEDCHSTWTQQICNDCGRTERFPNRCDNFYCPECQPRLAAERRKAVEWWTRLVSQPKHVVLTVKNTPELTKAHVQEFKQWWSRLRRLKFARPWLGGFYSLEVTNEGKGWHLHLHALIDCKYIDKAGLSEAWQKATNGLGRIVEVKDARSRNYLAEVTKYAVKGSQLAAWPAEDIQTFITAFSGVRSFGVFGTLYGARTKFAEFIATLRDAKPRCVCGSCNVRYQTEAQAIAEEFCSGQPPAPRPPPQSVCQRELGLDIQTPFLHRLHD